MYSVLTGLSGFLKFGNTRTDNWVFRLHYKATCLLLIAFSIVVSTNQFFGDPIDCVTSGADIPQNVIDNYCWVHSTYTLPSAFDKRVGVDVPHAGVAQTIPGDPKVYHAYYQWVCFFLFFQAVLFYIPRSIWRIKEGKKVDSLMLQLGKPFMAREANESGDFAKKSNEERIAHYSEMLVSYLRRSQGAHGPFAYIYYLCEVLNFANVVGQIFFANAFLGGEFTTYGTEVIKFSLEPEAERTDPMIEVFPRITKCTFRKYGPSGDIQNHDAMCILPINMINEKIFIFLWFWYIILSVLSGLVVLFHLVVIFSVKLRCWIITKGYAKGDDAIETLKDYTKRSNLSDWLLLKLLKENINPINFNEVVDCLATKTNRNSIEDTESGKSLLSRV